MKKRCHNSKNKKQWVVLVPIVKETLISSEQIEGGKIKNTYKKSVFHFYYCGQKNHTFTGDRNTMLLGNREECKVYTKDRAKEVLSDCQKYDKKNSDYYQLVKL